MHYSDLQFNPTACDVNRIGKPGRALGKIPAILFWLGDMQKSLSYPPPLIYTPVSREWYSP